MAGAPAPVGIHVGAVFRVRLDSGKAELRFWEVPPSWLRRILSGLEEFGTGKLRDTFSAGATEHHASGIHRASLSQVFIDLSE